MVDFDVFISKDKRSAHINLNKNNPDKIIESDIYTLLSKHGITFGIQRDVISHIAANYEQVSYPLLIAEGQNPINGLNGYLKIENPQEDQSNNSPGVNDVFNFRNVRKIPSVKKGQLIATIVPPTEGKPGKDVFGNEIRAFKGKPYRLKLGENTIENNGKIFAAIDGQVSTAKNKVGVLPLFEVEGDLSLKVGNIDFIGNVTVRGNVPSDYSIKAGGDLSIHGIVEGATIEAGGSVFISGGVVGFNKANIKANGDIIASFINQSKVSAGKNIEVTGSILHSECVAGDSVVSLTGNIIGGRISAGANVTARDIGNELHTKTEINMGTNNHLFEEEEKRTYNDIALLKNDLQKLDVIFQKLADKYKQTSSLSEEEIILLKRQNITKEELIHKVTLLEEELHEIKEKLQDTTRYNVVVEGSLYPNVYIHFGKYQRISNQLFHRVKIQLVNKEISINTFSTK
ncbi:DUF342 domain-containing protein [Fredinandcohnia sp. 179-A 10B2 NHS]|uniref:DUF342 domain-containing protein n=1 Tax=Fredinandcohnia sp. 179-A 10B2 NHS TaxID=3235176 RepID=UPI0039A196C1